MDIIKGIPVSPGVAIGRVFVLQDDSLRITRSQIPELAVTREVERLDSAVEESIEELRAISSQAEQEMGVDAAKIFLFHIGMLEDRSLTDPMRDLIRNEQVSAEYAVYQTLTDLSRRFAAMADSAFTTKVNDLDDLSSRLIHKLIGERTGKLADLEQESVVAASDLTPSQTAGFDRSKVRAFVTDLGGRTSHTAIVARALGIPAVVGCKTVTSFAANGSTMIVDGDRGVVVIDPDEEKLDEYHSYMEQRETRRLSLGELADLPSTTRDGVDIQLLGNIEFADEIRSVLEYGGQGVGLFRTEFLYLTRESEPSEEEHFEAYKRCIDLLDGKALVIRTVDLGADKYTQAQIETPERNPFLGCRSIRYCLKSIPMFRLQLRAILRVSALGPVKVMFPLVTSANEFRQAKWLLNDVMEDLADERIPFDDELKVGMMVEVPSAAIMAGSLAREADFFSIGTNDLVQYTLAVDRTNERVAHMYNPAHPAVIKLIRDVMRAARRAEIPVSCCGESAGDLDYAILLIGLGLRTLSATASSIPHLKRLVRSVTIEQCERIARRAVAFDSDAQVAAYLRNQARKIIPDAFDGRTAE